MGQWGNALNQATQNFQQGFNTLGNSRRYQQELQMRMQQAEQERQRQNALDQMNMRVKSAELNALQNPQPESYTLSPGQERYRGDERIAGVPKQEDPYGNLSPAVRDQIMAGQDPIVRSALDRSLEGKRGTAAAGASTTTIKNMGTIPPGYTVQYDQQGNPVQMSPIPGGPVEREMQEKSEKEAGRQEQTARAGGTVIQDINRAINVVKKNPLSSGAPAVVMKHIPETDARAVEGFIQSALSNVGLDTLQQMRENSPTGGALGQVPIQQQKRLEQVLGSLDSAQEKPILMDNLRRVNNIYMDIVHGTPEQIQRRVDEGKISPKRAQQLMFRYPLSFDEFGRPKEQDGGGFEILGFE